MDTTSVRHVNADAADKFAGFNLRFGKLPQGGGPLRGPYRPVLTARVPRRDSSAGSRLSLP
jgi:hypothetical protein